MGAVVTVSLCNTGLIPSNRDEELLLLGAGGSSIGGGEAASFGKDNSSEFRDSVSPASSWSFLILKSLKSHFLPINALILVVDTLQG